MGSKAANQHTRIQVLLQSQSYSNWFFLNPDELTYSHVKYFSIFLNLLSLCKVGGGWALLSIRFGLRGYSGLFDILPRPFETFSISAIKLLHFLITHVLTGVALSISTKKFFFEFTTWLCRKPRHWAVGRSHFLHALFTKCNHLPTLMQRKRWLFSSKMKN